MSDPADFVAPEVNPYDLRMTRCIQSCFRIAAQWQWVTYQVKLSFHFWTQNTGIYRSIPGPDARDPLRVITTGGPY